MNGTLRVTPEKLIATAQSFASTASTAQGLTATMLSTVDSLQPSWAGEAATAYSQKAHGLEDSINKMVRMIQEHAQDLEVMAKNYQEAEKASLDNASNLKTDVII